MVNVFNDSFRQDSSNDEAINESSKIQESFGRRRVKVALADNIKTHS